jgi:hypothetical protein
VDAWRALEAEGGGLDRARLQARMLERFLSCEAVKYNVLQEDVVYLMERLDQTLETAPSPQEERLVSV